MQDIEATLPKRFRGEGAIDWMVRYGLALSPQSASDALIVARGLEGIRDALLEEAGLPDAL